MNSLPKHLQKYIVSQNQESYSAIEHSTWRFLLKQLKSFLSQHAHPSYLKGLEKTGITIDKIPSIENISQHLSEFGWRALPVSGFIPPAAFMELQSLGVLPIASEMRTLEHFLYTPAPDIVHEAAGHAPLLIDPNFSAYLKDYAQVSRKALLSKEDLRIYKAIRVLSDLKENPKATPQEIQRAMTELSQAQKNVTHLSEGALLARMNWWTAEYGLYGNMKNPPLIYGAGLLSSLGEAQWCLSDKVKKIPFSLDCINYAYDITEPQPQLFVVENFDDLRQALKEFSCQMSFKQGGLSGLKKALDSQTVNSFELNSGLQIGGQLQNILRNNEGQVCYLNWIGPCQLAYNDTQIPHHGPDYHKLGYGTPLGYLENLKYPNPQPPFLWSQEDWLKQGYRPGEKITLEWSTGVKLQGVLHSFHIKENKTLIATFNETLVTYRDKVLFEPSWGTYDLALGTQIVSVWGGAPDRSHFVDLSDFESVKVSKPPLNDKELKQNQFYSHIQKLNETLENTNLDLTNLETLWTEHQKEFQKDWLFDWEVFELLKKSNNKNSNLYFLVESQLKSHMNDPQKGPFIELINSLIKNN